MTLNGISHYFYGWARKITHPCTHVLASLKTRKTHSTTALALVAYKAKYAPSFLLGHSDQSKSIYSSASRTSIYAHRKSIKQRWPGGQAICADYSAQRLS